MPSYPIRPTFPIDVRSTPSIVATQEGTSIRFDLAPGAAVLRLIRETLPTSPDGLAPGEPWLNDETTISFVPSPD